MRRRRRTSTHRRTVHLFLPGLLIAAGLWAYHNSFRGVFLLDDRHSILENPDIRQLWQPWRALWVPSSESNVMRPLFNFSLAVNYAVGRFDVWGYHAVNLAIHLTAALILFGLIRRTLRTPRLKARYGPAASRLAFAVAVLWVVHPLQTQSVTYIVQRAEALMGLCYLLTLYGLVRSVSAPARGAWTVGTVLSCALGMLSKPVMVTAPLMSLLYDRIFLAGSVRAAWRQRKGLYVALAATWGLLVVVMTTAPPHPQPTAGLGLTVTPLEYVATQPGVVLRYLQLALWPHPLVFDYQWPVARTLGAILPPALLVGLLGWCALWALRRVPAVGFLGTWVFLILAPTSSLIPISDPAFEYRMYLPLAGVLGLLVVGGWEVLQRWVASEPLRRRLAGDLLVVLVAAFGMTTIRRNDNYRNEAVMWHDVITKRPNNARAHNNLGFVLAEQGRWEEAIAEYTAALHLAPRYAHAHNNLGVALDAQGKLDEAIAEYTAALQLSPHYVHAHNNLGTALAEQGKLEEAIAYYTEALRIKPDYADARENLQEALLQQQHLTEATSR